jgi:hypothetical protein
VSGINIGFDPEALRPLIEAVVRETVARMEEARGRRPDKLAFSEEDAARLLDLEPHVLRDEQRRGRIQASQIVGKRIRYTHEDLTGYLLGRRFGAGNGNGRH